MKSKQVKIQISSAFDKDGNLVKWRDAESETQRITVAFPENAPIATVSVGAELPLAIAPFMYAKQSVHISIPCIMDEDEINQAQEFCQKFTEENLNGCMKKYVSWMDKCNIDWKAVEKSLKNKASK
tara:strand:+ start:1076 stop:1453 length:378 start_codon:yes stop_codon:yes gene_type:complete